MDVYGHRKQTYKAGLAQPTQRQASFEQRSLPTQISLPFYTTTAPIQQTPVSSNHDRVSGKPNGNYSIPPPPQHHPVNAGGSHTRTPSYLTTHPSDYLGNKRNNNNNNNNTSIYYSKVVEPSTPDPSPVLNNRNINSLETTPVQSMDRNGSTSRRRKGFQKWAHYRAPSIDSTSNDHHAPLLLSATIHLIKSFEQRDSKFTYHQKLNPKRILTKPSKPAKNDGYDNEDHDYILHVNDILGEDENYRYRVIDLLGQGTFGQVVKCEHLSSGKLFSVKVIKNRPAFRTQSCMEVEILKKLNQKMDNRNQHHILRLEHTFNHKNHLCLVFELLSFNLYELIKQNGFKGLSIQLVRNITTQLLETLVFLGDSMIIHCDLKPENILLEAVDSPKIKVIDFGSACHKANPGYTYIQSRFYRSPEVILKCRYTHAIDMWSLGCIVAELFLGIPLFPGNNEYDQLDRIMDMLGQPPSDVLDRGGNTMLYFDRESIGHGKYQYKRKSREKYNKDNHKQEMPSKRFFQYNTLPDIIMHASSSLKPSVSGSQAFRLENQMRQWLVDFLLNTLTLSPLRRWNPKEALQHPFITGKSQQTSTSDIASRPLPVHPKATSSNDSSSGQHPQPISKDQHLPTTNSNEKQQMKQQPHHDQQSDMDHQQKQNYERYLYHQHQKLLHQQQQDQHQSHHPQKPTEKAKARKVESFETSPLITIDAQQSRHTRSRSLHVLNPWNATSSKSIQSNNMEPSSIKPSSSLGKSTTIAERRALRLHHAKSVGDSSGLDGSSKAPSPKKSSSDTVDDYGRRRQRQHRSSVSFAPDPLKETDPTSFAVHTFSSTTAPKPTLKNIHTNTISTYPPVLTKAQVHQRDGDELHTMETPIPLSHVPVKYRNHRQQPLYG